MRTYEKTHPWLTFSVDFSRAPSGLWIMLGECQSKCEHIAGVPLRPDTANKLYQLYLAKGVLATTAIEGNTLSEEEVLRHLQGRLKLPPSREYLAQEIDNIVTGCNLILSDIKARRTPTLTSDIVKKLNQIVLDKLRLDEEVMPGEIRGHAVGVGRYHAPPAQDCEYLLDRLCEWLNSKAFNPRPETVIVYAILKAVLAHLYLAWIHPFGDGNGRTARLVEFQILIASGVPAPAAHLLSNHYNQTRTEYYRQLDHASRSGGDVLPFILYATQGLLDGLRSQLQDIRAQQLDVAWRNYVHETFSDKKSPSDARRRHLVLDLSQGTRPLPLSELSQVSPRIAAAYARKTAKTLSRDVKALIQMGLLAQEPDGFRARKDLILAFLPPKAETMNN
ncbi:MAG: Fic family protein [Candidatus Methylomirabilis oxygeniifera]|uniref:Fido domain-containing protein n=1 Tax=Methylomirabilis oxygeniifera TaxID=671143 RepID=D5MK89_METO1|nr:MAG: Fic family protein [Candidatus Methylomirabilis oxyfera]CBE69711.1 conserved protein of unknown function [Candidatus Methylomirabilis oxyfera]